MKKSRFRILQGALFGATAAAAWADDVSFHDNSSPEDESSRAIPTVSRHRVLRRHLQGHLAFVVGALGNVGMPVPDNPGIFANFADAAGAVALDFLNADNNGAELFSYQSLTSRLDNYGAALAWTGDMRFSMDGGAHVRFQQTYNDLFVQGGNLLVHTDAAGNVVAVNGEYVDCKEQIKMLHQANDLLKPDVALARGLKFAGMGEAVISQTEPEMTLVVGEDLTCCLAYQSTVDYWEMDVVTNTKVQNQDILYADATQGRFCAREPLVMGSYFRKRMDARSSQSSPVSRAHRMLSPENNTETNDDGNSDGDTEVLAKIATYFCTPSTEDRDPGTAVCELVSNSSTPISTGDLSVDSAHNYALATFNYYWYFHGLNSLDGNGYELISLVLSEEFELANGMLTHKEDNFCCRISFSLLTNFPSHIL